MTVTISPSDPRSVRALAVLSTAPTWTKGHTKDGRPFFVIPGSRGRIYWTDTRDCTCPDRQERQVACKHMLAVRMWTLANTPAAPAPKGAGSAGPVVLTDAEDARLELAFAALSPLAGPVVQTFGPTRYDALFPVEG